jgi:hypothetical protein
VGLQWDGIWGFVEVVVDGKSVIEVVSPAPASQCEVLTAVLHRAASSVHGTTVDRTRYTRTVRR